MKREINRDLLIDLARLAKKYPSEEWDSIISWLQDEESRKRLLALIQELTEISKKVKGTPKRGQRASGITRLLDEVREADPQKAELLGEFWRKLQSHEILPTFSTLRMFAEAAGLPIFSAKKREQAVNELIRQFATLPYTNIQNALQKASIAHRDFGEDYERWVSLILGSRENG